MIWQLQPWQWGGQVAARGHKVPFGTGLNKEGEKTDDPSQIANGKYFSFVIIKDQR